MQGDSLPVFFSLFAVYLAINNRFFFSAVTLDIGILLKLYPLVLVLPLAIYAWKRSASAIQQPTPLTRFALGLALFFLPLGLFADRFLMFLQGWLVYPQYPTTVGYGLTFWSISYVVPIGQSAVLVSPAIGVLLVAYIYHRIWSTRLQESLPALSAFAASSVIAVLLSSRFVGENFVVWILPFCAILAAFGLLEKPLFWIMSFVAFAFSITSNLLPFYMLPLAPYIGSELSAIVEAVQPYRIMSGATFHPGLTTGTLFVASIGILFSVCLALVLAETLFPSARHIIRNSWMRIRSFIR